MTAVGQLQLDFPTYRQIALAPAGAKRWVSPLFGLLGLLCGSALISLGEPIASEAVLLTASLVLICLYDLAVLLGWRQTKPLTARPWRYEITDKTVGVYTPQTAVTVSWEGISRARIRRHAWVLRLAGTRRSVAIPRRAFSAEAQHQIDQFIGSRHLPATPQADPPGQH